MKRILVTGAGGSPSYNFIKSLRNNPRNEQFYIVGTDTEKFHIELSDVNTRYIVPTTSHPEYLSVLNRIVEEEKIDFIHSQPEQEVFYLAKNKRRLKAKTLLPNPKTIEICQNKIALHKVLQENSVTVPQAYHIQSADDLIKGMNALLKTNQKVWLRAIRGAGSRAALPVINPEHAKMWIDYWHTMKGLTYEDFMVSEFLPGDEYAFQSVWHNGEIIVSQARKRMQYLFGNLFISGQSSSPSVAVTVRNEEVNKTSYNAVRAVDPHATGVFCVDLKTDKKGKIAIMEINAGRFFTTSYFFSKAGCNMPYYYTLLGLGESISGDLKPFNNLPENLYWIRMMDMGYKLVEDDSWTSKEG